MTNMPTYRQITQPAAHEHKPDVASHHDIDWRQVSVAEAIDADRARQLEQRATLARLKAKRPTGFWSTFCQLFGARS